MLKINNLKNINSMLRLYVEADEEMQNVVVQTVGTFVKQVKPNIVALQDFTTTLKNELSTFCTEHPKDAVILYVNVEDGKIFVYITNFRTEGFVFKETNTLLGSVYVGKTKIE